MVERKECGCCRSWVCEDGKKKKEQDLPGCLYSKAPDTWILSFSLYTIALAAIYEPRSWKCDPCYSHRALSIPLFTQSCMQLSGSNSRDVLSSVPWINASHSQARGEMRTCVLCHLSMRFETCSPRSSQDPEWSWLALKQPSLKLV
jgi:hypothetical protein